MLDRRTGLTGEEQRHGVRWLLAIVVAGVVAGVLWDLLFGRLIPLRPEGIRDWLDSLGSLAPVVYIAAMTVAVVVSPVPSVPLDIAAGLAFGMLWGTVYTLIGAEIGAVVAFLIARRLGRPWLARRLSPGTMRRIDALTARQGVKALLMRLLPVFNFDWVSYAAGLTSMSLGRFALATLVGMTPPVVAIVAVGANLTERPLLAGGIFAALLALALGPVIVAAAMTARMREDTRV